MPDAFTKTAAPEELNNRALGSILIPCPPDYSEIQKMRLPLIDFLRGSAPSGILDLSDPKVLLVDSFLYGSSFPYGDTELMPYLEVFYGDRITYLTVRFVTSRERDLNVGDMVDALYEEVDRAAPGYARLSYVLPEDQTFPLSIDSALSMAKDRGLQFKIERTSNRVLLGIDLRD